MNVSPFRGTSPKLPRSIYIAIAKVHEPFDGRTAICPRMQGHTKSQLQVSTYCPLMFHTGVVMASPQPVLTAAAGLYETLPRHVRLLMAVELTN